MAEPGNDIIQWIHDRTIPPVDKYLILRAFQSRDARRFYDMLVKHMETVLPYLYTPTVGEACMHYHTLNIPTYGMYLPATEKGSFLRKLQALPNQNVAIVVVTDGERILGLGDLGAGGMGIAEGKSLLYTAAAGVDPSALLPVCLDVGTNNTALLSDRLYPGLRRRRLVGQEFEELMEEFVTALISWRPHVCLHFEDFSNHTAFDLLHRYRKRICCFNDDIQGTATICLAGLLSALRATSASLADQRVLFLGAGEAGTGIAELIAIAVERGYGLSREEGRRRCYFVDSKGLVCAARTDLQPHKRPFAWDLAPCTTLLEAVRQLRPTALIGVSTSQGAFSREVLTLMGEYNQRPIIFPLSNPTSKSECTFEEAFDATQGRVLFASGSPFPPLQHGSRVYTPAQANNAYCFPAIGYAAVLCRASEISDDAFLLAAETLAGITPIADLEVGFLFPRFAGIRDVSARLIAVIAHDMCRRGSGTLPDDFPKPLVSERGRLAQLAQWEGYVKTHMFASAPAARL